MSRLQPSMNHRIRGFVGIELGIAIAALILLGIAAVGGYAAYHARVDAGGNASATTTATSTGSATSTPPTSPLVPPQPIIPLEPGASATSSDSISISPSDNGKTFRIHVGDTVSFDVGTGQRWSIAVGDSGILVPVASTDSLSAVPIYEAEQTGTVLVRGTGAPICNPGMACPQYVMTFTVTIVVE